jgi:hypothetical protein
MCFISILRYVYICIKNNLNMLLLLIYLYNISIYFRLDYVKFQVCLTLFIPIRSKKCIILVIVMDFKYLVIL